MCQWLTLTATAAAQTVKISILSPASCATLMAMMWFSNCQETKHGQGDAGPAEALIIFRGFYGLLMFIVLLSTRHVGRRRCRLMVRSPVVHQDQGGKHFLLTGSGADWWGLSCQSASCRSRKLHGTRENTALCMSNSYWRSQTHKREVFLTELQCCYLSLD